MVAIKKAGSGVTTGGVNTVGSGTASAWKKVSVTVKMIDEATLSGTFTIARDARLSDFLNNQKKDFVTLVDHESQPYMLNKRHIIKVTELQE